MSRKKLAWANKEAETFVCILGEEDVVYDVYVAAAVIDIRPTTKDKNLTADFPSSGVKLSATADQVRKSRVTGTPEPTETLQGGHVIVLDAMSSSTSSTDHVQYKNLTADFPSSGVKSSATADQVRESRVTGTPEPTETLQGGHVIVLDAMSSSTSSTDHVQYKNWTADFPSSGVKSSATAHQVRESRVTGTSEPTETLQGGHVIVLDAMSSSTSSTDHVQYKNLTADFPSSGVKSSATAHQVRESRVTGTPEPTETLQGGHVIVLDAMSSSTSSTDHVQYKNLTADFPSSGVKSSATADQVGVNLSHLNTVYLSQRLV
ncbi:unnamed protein product [Boreogadus saida]